MSVHAPVSEHSKLTRRVILLSLENMAKMTPAVSTGDFNSESLSVPSHAEVQCTNLVIPQDLSSCLQAGQIMATIIGA
jgi:endonuclease/exonuclease/phosphatase family metal-dependent hydrolase